MIKLGIIGYPLKHTLSPAMHNSALRHLGMEGHYYALETDPEDMVDRIKSLKVDGYHGFNVTIPLKVWITPLLNSVDDYANLAGAVNTVVITQDKLLKGYNTDVYGFIEAIPESLRTDLKAKKAAVLGSGGAARAIAVGLASIGVDEITFYARNQEKAAQLQQIVQRNFPEIEIKVKKYNEYADLSFASIVVNTTPIGLEGASEDYSPLTKRSLKSLPDDAIVYDLVYKPRTTKLLQYAKERDLITIDGAEMLILQGAKAFEIWTDQKAPIEIMREAVLKNL